MSLLLCGLTENTLLPGACRGSLDDSRDSPPGRPDLRLVWLFMQYSKGVLCARLYPAHRMLRQNGPERPVMYSSGGVDRVSICISDDDI